MTRYGQFVVRWRFAIVAAWLAGLGAGVTLLPDVERSRTGTLGDLVPTEAAAIDTEVRSIELFSFPVLSRTVVVERGTGGPLSAAEVRDVLARAAAIARRELPGVESIAFALAVTDNVFAGRPGRPARSALTYLYFPPEIGPVGRTGLAHRLVERFVLRPEVEAGVTGAVPARSEQVEAITGALPRVEIATLIVITLAVGLFFRSLVAPVANLLVVGTAYLASVRLIGGLGQAVGISIPQEVEPVMVALLFGVVTDYFIFFVSRMRRMAADGLPWRAAAERTTATLTPIILTAGLSVAAASAALVVAQLGFFRAFGPGLALAVLVAVAVVLTLVPALLAILGRALLWPGRARSAGTPPRARRRGRLGAMLRRRRAALLTFPVDHPVRATLLCGLPLLALAALTPGLNFANTQISGLPADSPPKEAFAVVADDFPPGAVAPTMVLVEGEQVGTRAAALERLHGLLSGYRNVAEVVGPASVPDEIDFGATTSPGDDAVRHVLILDVNPFGARAIGTVERLREDLPGMLERAGLDGATASLAGDTALSEETARKTAADLVRIVPVAALAVLLILAVFLRALVAPIYLVAASLLSLAASLGLTVLVFQDLLGFGEITFYVPFAGIVLLIALGSDYNVYLVGRVWAEARHRELREAVRVAGGRATSAITVAGLVLALSFAALFLVPLRSFHELAFLLSTGLLIDAFLVRAILAPALITLFGPSGGWPGGALRQATSRPWKDGGEDGG